MKSKCECKYCQSITEPNITECGKYKIICPECGGFRVVFDAHVGSVSCHACRNFDTYYGIRVATECYVAIEKLLESK